MKTFRCILGLLLIAITAVSMFERDYSRATFELLLAMFSYPEGWFPKSRVE
jgi:hypothetical protein